MTAVATLSPPSLGLSAPLPLDRPTRRGKTVRVPERWTGPLSRAPFEAALLADGGIALGVGLTCPKGQRRTGAIWIPCVDGRELADRAEALDAALMAANGGFAPPNDDGKPDARGKASKPTQPHLGGVPAARVLEALAWIEAGATGADAALRLGCQVSGARSLFADRAHSIKRALGTLLPPQLAALVSMGSSLKLH